MTPKKTAPDLWLHVSAFRNAAWIIGAAIILLTFAARPEDAPAVAPPSAASDKSSKSDVVKDDENAADVVPLPPLNGQTGGEGGKAGKSTTETKRIEEAEAARLAAEAKKKAEAEELTKRAAEAKRIEEAEAARLAAEAKKKAETEELAKRAAEAKRIEEAESARLSAEAKKKAETEEIAKRAAEAKRIEEAESARRAAEAKKKAETEELAKRAAEAKRIEEAEAVRLAAEVKKKAEAEELAKRTAEKLADETKHTQPQQPTANSQQPAVNDLTKKLEQAERDLLANETKTRALDAAKHTVAGETKPVTADSSTLSAAIRNEAQKPVVPIQLSTGADQNPEITQANSELPNNQQPTANSQPPTANLAETVPLPAIPDPGALSRTPRDDLATVSLTLDTSKIPEALATQTVIFNLYGPEPFLRTAGARYVLRDDLGRELERNAVKVQDLPFTEGKPRQIKLSVNHPLTHQYVLNLVLTGTNQRQVERSVSFALPSDVAAPNWDRWLALISSSPQTADWPRLQAMGIRGGLQYRLHPARREALRKAGVPFYVENIGHQLLSRYQTEPGLWDKTIQAMGTTSPNADGNSHRSLWREPSLCSQPFAEAFASELARHVETYSKDPPLFYSLASEPSMTRLAAAADFDFNPAAIAEFQRWLERDMYGTLKTLNTSWHTRFNAWNEVLPMTTDEARLRLKDGVMNFGPWVDFRDFQDYTFNRVLRDGADFIRQRDHNAKVGITGAMGAFAFGGWDWSRLSQSMDVIESYDIGGARALWRDLAPGKPALATLMLPRTTDPELQSTVNDCTRTMWSLALEGGTRGVLLWDENTASATDNKQPSTVLLDRDGNPSALAQGLAPVLKILDSDAGTLLAHARRSHDGVAVLYSPASVRVHWLLEAEHFHGERWLQAWGRDSSAERRQSIQLRLRESWGKLLDDMGLGWRFVSSAQVEKKEILRPDANIKTLVLPQAIALSDDEIAVLKQFVQDGGKLIVDACCGRFDEHGVMREKPALDELFGIDTSQEPFFAEPMNPLERIKPLPGFEVQSPLFGPTVLQNIAPVFSDKPMWLGKTRDGAEYRRSPVLASCKAGVFLNLDLSSYLLWRLHPDSACAGVTRDVIAAAGFQNRLAEGLVDWKNTRLPQGTQLISMQMDGSSSVQLLALRRNPQARLHELGSETDGNWAFEKSEPFVLALRAPAWVSVIQTLPITPAIPREVALQKIEGSLDPNTPCLFRINSVQPSAPNVAANKNIQAGEILELKISPEPGEKESGSHLYSVHVIGPDSAERAYYGAAPQMVTGIFTHVIPFALNDPSGQWIITVRDLTSGGETTVTVELAAQAISLRN